MKLFSLNFADNQNIKQTMEEKRNFKDWLNENTPSIMKIVLIVALLLAIVIIVSLLKLSFST